MGTRRLYILLIAGLLVAIVAAIVARRRASLQLDVEPHAREAIEKAKQR